MKIRRLVAVLMTALMLIPTVYGQRPQGKGGAKPGGMEVDSWEVNVRQMSPKVRAEITETMDKLKGTDEDRSILAHMGQSVGMGLVSGLVDAVVSETFNLIQYRKRQKQEWMQMIERENNYVDSITSIKGLKDFYNSNSHRGALDPSDMNFDGIEIRGMRNGKEVIYMSCSIDRSRIDHLFRHSKFNLVLDTLSFFPYQCHLPNITANGIRTMNELKKGKAQMVGDTIIRPGKGGNGFSFDERNNLRVAIDFTLYSSWINEAVQVHKDVELGKFSFNIRIPDNVVDYTYSRRDVLQEAEKIPEGIDRERFLNEHLLAVEGDCFVVPRSYMPLDTGEPMWGTGEYDIKVRIKESCQFAENSEKAKHWREDYKRLRKMQNRSSEVKEYFQTLWNQYGNTLVKSSYKTALSTGVNDLVSPYLTGASAAGAGRSAAAGASAGGAAQAGGAAPKGGAPAAGAGGHK